MNKVQMDPVGIVKSSFTSESGDKWSVADVVLDEKYTSALKGIENYSHVIVLFWMNKISDSSREVLEVHPRGRKDMPLVGVFATRGRSRPNPIGLAIVELIAKENNLLKVRGLDAFDGTFVLDIKPYDYYDVKQGIRVPEWWLKLSRQKDGKR